jgi:hypothetical protein
MSTTITTQANTSLLSNPRYVALLQARAATARYLQAHGIPWLSDAEQAEDDAQRAEILEIERLAR